MPALTAKPLIAGDQTTTILVSSHTLKVFSRAVSLALTSLKPALMTSEPTEGAILLVLEVRVSELHTLTGWRLLLRAVAITPHTPDTARLDSLTKPVD